MLEEDFSRFWNISGMEAMMYEMFVKVYGTREKTGDVLNPRYSINGDIMLPRNSLIHYQQQLPGEIGPSNTAPFISNFDKRINIYFNLNNETPLGTIQNLVFQPTGVIKGYEGSHFIYTRTRNYQSVINKEQELLVNNLAIGQIPIVYRRRTVFTPFQKSYNDLYTLISSVNEFSKYGRRQFVEFKLPRSFPSYNTLMLQFNKYKKFFDDEFNITKYDKITLAPFQAEQSFWLFDLYGILLGFDEAKYSQFNRLNDEARKQLEIIFTYNGKCWIVNLQNLINLLSYNDKEKDKAPSKTKINYFKRVYLNLINLVTPIAEDAIDHDSGSVEEPEELYEDGDDDGVVEEVKRPKKSEKERLPEQDPNLVVDNRPSSMADLYSSNKGSSAVPVDTKGDAGTKTDNSSPDIEQGSPEDEPENLWGGDIDDSLFERSAVEDVVTVASKKDDVTPLTSIERELTTLAKTGQLTTKEKDFFLAAANSYKDIEIGGRTLAEIIDIKKEDMIIKEEKIAPDSIVVRDKNALRSRTQELSKSYIRNIMDRNMIEMILAVQNGKTALVGLEREDTITADSKYSVYTMVFQPIKGGSRSTRRIRVPLVDEDDESFTINNVKTYAQTMRMELPIRKISPTKVALTSYYDKKIMIERSLKNKDDFNRWLKANIIEASYKDPSLKVSLGGQKIESLDVCYYYSVLASRFKAIATEEYVFDFVTSDILKVYPKWEKYCNGASWVIGVKGEHPILIDGSGLITIDGTEIGYFEEVIGLNIAKAPTPTATININGYQFPVIAVLSYWLGLDAVIKALKVDYRVVEPGTKVNLTTDEFVVAFADEKLVFNRRDEKSTLIMSGLNQLSNLTNFSRSHLNDPNVWFSLISDQRVKPSHFKEMSLIYDMFIDPITARLLKQMGYSVIMDKLVVEAVELLLSNQAEHEIEIKEQRLVGYERFSGHIYREMVRATRQYRNKPNNGKKTFDINPEAVMMAILTDPSFQSTEEVNPVHQVKQQEEVTFGGTLGRSDRAMVRRTRGQLDSYTGIISEGGKDSGKVGFISYATTDAKIVDLYGNIDPSLPTTDVSRGSIVMNLLYGTTKDDTKRTLFSGVQQSQVMAAENYVANPLRTTYDSLLAYRTSELYSSIAKEEGTIKEVNEFGITVEYADGKTDVFYLGYSIGKGAGEYHKHNKVTDKVVGDKFIKGEVLAWDEMFFTRDTVDPTRVVWMSGGMARIALGESQFEFEDSVAITKDYAIRSASPYVKPNDFVVESNQSLKMHVKVGDTVEYDQILCDVENQVSAAFEYEDSGLFSGLDRMGIKQIKAKQSGVITKIEVEYNGDIEDWDESLKVFIKKQDGKRAKVAKYKKRTASTGDVGGNTSIGKSKIYHNTALIYIYIENKITTTTADKLVIGNQMKGTVGFIYEDQIYTEDGRKVDITFSLKSLLNRMVLSLRDKIVANETNNVYTSRLIQKYGRYDE